MHRAVHLVQRPFVICVGTPMDGAEGQRMTTMTRRPIDNAFRRGCLQSLMARLLDHFDEAELYYGKHRHILLATGIMRVPSTVRVYPLTGAKIARTAEHSRTGKAIPKGVISQFEAAEAKKDREIEKVTPSRTFTFKNSHLV